MTALFPVAAPDVLYLVDLSSYVLRAYHAIAPLQSPSGEPTHAIHGTVTMLERLVRERKPALFAIAMDSGRDTFRRDIYAEYKSHRPPAPPELSSQFKRCEEIVRAFSVACFKQERVEADDLIATAVKRAREQGLRTVIVAADKDLMQLVGDDVIMWDTMRDKVIGPVEVLERFGVEVAQVADLLALMGDSSDNIPGVPHVGPKTARELLNEYTTLDGIYASLAQIKRKALRENLETHRDQAFLSRRLVALKDDCPVDASRERLAWDGRDYATLKQIYADLGLNRQLTQLETEEAARGSATSTEAAPGAPAAAALLPATSEVVVSAAPVEYRTITDLAELARLADEARAAGTIALDLALEPASALRGDLIGIGLAVAPGKAAYVPLLHRYVGAPKQLTLAEVLATLGPLLAENGARLETRGRRRLAPGRARRGLCLRRRARELPARPGSSP